MRVGFNLVFLVPGETGGMETVARELIPRLVGLRPEWEWLAFTNREAAGTPGPWLDIESVTVPVHARSRMQWVAGEQVLLPRLARRHGVDLVHSLGSTAPAHGAFARVTTIHDLNYLRVPEAHFGLRGLGMRVLVPLGARRSTRILADSRSTREDVIAELGVPAERVDEAPLGVAEGDPPAAMPEGALRRELGLGERPFLLSVSAKRPHKNLLRLIDAVARIDGERRPLLVLPGYPTSHEPELRARSVERGVAADVRFLDWVPDDQLEALYAHCAAFVFPSLYEGFGLPVLDAMRRGAPVACSDRSSLPQVAGDAALLFDPEDTNAIASAIERLLAGGPEVDRLRAAGPRQAARFTWEGCARATLAGYDRALGDRTTGSSARPPVPPSARALIRESIGLGSRGLRRAPRREAFWRVWMPLDVDRVHELPWAGRSVLGARPARVLDLSSPKLLACWLAAHSSAEVVATDLWAAEVETWRDLVAKADPAGGRFARLRLEAADATRLPYPDASFDAVYSVSVIEHIPGDGDGQAMAEIERVLRPGGVAALTFPYRSAYFEEFVEQDLYGQRYTGTPLFFYRHYDDAAVRERLLAGRALDVVERGIWTKPGVRESADAARSVLPSGLGLGRALGPLLTVVGARAMRDGDPAAPATDNVMRLLVRRR